MPTHSHKQQQSPEGLDGGWMLICAVMVLTCCLIALPWILLGFMMQRLLARWLHWRLHFFLWFVLLFVGGYLLYLHYQFDLQAMITRELVDYVDAGKHYQFDLARWPLPQLWADTWPVWLSTLPGIGVAGFAAELSTNLRPDTTRTLQQQERRRQLRAQRFQLRARKRASRAAHLPDEIGGNMVIGIAIHDDEEA